MVPLKPLTLEQKVFFERNLLHQLLVEDCSVEQALRLQQPQQPEALVDWEVAKEEVSLAVEEPRLLVEAEASSEQNHNQHKQALGAVVSSEVSLLNQEAVAFSALHLQVED